MAGPDAIDILEGLYARSESSKASGSSVEEKSSVQVISEVSGLRPQTIKERLAILLVALKLKDSHEAAIEIGKISGFNLWLSDLGKQDLGPTSNLGQVVTLVKDGITASQEWSIEARRVGVSQAVDQLLGLDFATDEERLALLYLAQKLDVGSEAVDAIASLVQNEKWIADLLASAGRSSFLPEAIRGAMGLDIFRRLQLLVDAEEIGDPVGSQQAIHTATQNLETLSFQSPEERCALLHLELLLPAAHESRATISRICEADPLFTRNEFEPKLLSHLKVLKTSVENGQPVPDGESLALLFDNPRTVTERLVAMHALRLISAVQSEQTEAVATQLPVWRRELLDPVSDQVRNFGQGKPQPNSSISNTGQVAQSRNLGRFGDSQIPRQGR